VWADVEGPRIIDTKTLRVLARSGEELAERCCFTADGATLALGTDAGVHLLPVAHALRTGRVRLADGELVHWRRRGLGAPVSGALLVRSDRILCGAARRSEPFVGCTDLEGKLRWSARCDGLVQSMDLSSDGRALVVGTARGSVHVLEVDPLGASERRTWILRDGDPFVW
jgi:hypothetical protein